jgi:hypothetical protein
LLKDLNNLKSHIQLNPTSETRKVDNGLKDSVESGDERGKL